MERFSLRLPSILLYGRECWALRVKRNEQSILRWICGVKLSHGTTVDSLPEHLGKATLITLPRSRHLEWFGHLNRSYGWINTCLNLRIKKRSNGRFCKTWNDVIQDGLRSWNLMKDCCAVDRVIRRSDAESAAKAFNPCFMERRH